MAKKPHTARAPRGEDFDLAAIYAHAARQGRPVTIVAPADTRFMNPPPAVATIYFIGPENGPIKIGYASRLAFRLRDLRLANAYPLQVWASVDGAPLSLEREYHKRFAAHRLHGEWFARCPEIEAEIIRLNATHDVEGGNLG